MTDIETRLRDGLGAEPAPVSADTLLRDVRRGVRRRRTRRTVSLAAATTLALTGAFAVATTRDHPRVLAPSQHTPAVRTIPRGLAVSAAGVRFKTVLNDGCASPCAAVWSQQGDAGWVRTATIPDQLAGFTMAPDGENGWASGVTAIWSTHDAGHSWARVPAFASPRLRGVGFLSGPTVAWAILRGSHGARLWRAPVASDAWTRVTPPPSLQLPSMEDVLPDSRVVLGDLNARSSTVQHVVVGDGTSWHRYSIPCYQVPDLLGREPSTRAIACGLTRQVLDTSPDANLLPARIHEKPSGSSVGLSMVTSGARPVGQVRTLFVSGSTAVVYGPDGQRPARLTLGLHEVMQQFAVSGEHAVLSTSLGRVFASDDGGYTWTLLPQ